MHTGRCGRVALAITTVLFLASPALAAERPRIAIAGVRGDRGGAIEKQLARGLCTLNDCVPGARVRRGGRVDFASARAARVDGILFATAIPARRRVEVALLVGSLTPRRTWTLALDRRGQVPGAALDELAAELRAALAPAPPPARAPIAPAPRTVAPVPEHTAAPAPVSPAPSAPLEAPAPSRAPAVAEVAEVPPSPGPAPAREELRRAEAPARGSPSLPGPRPAAEAPAAPEVVPGTRWLPYLAVDLGVEVTRRRFVYEGTSARGGMLYEHSVDSIMSPVVRLEVAPLAGAAGRWYGGVTAFAAYDRSVGARTRDTQTGREYDTTLARLDAGAGLRFRPIGSARATVLVRASYRTWSLAVTPRGAIAGLADADLAGPSAGLDLEAPFGSWGALLLGGSYTQWTSADDLVGAFFGSGSAWAFDGILGLQVNVLQPVALRVLAEYARTTYSLSGASAYVATGATDEYVTGRAVARVAF